MAIHNVRLPEDVERGAKGGPGFLTTIVSLVSGAEQRNQEWAKARGSWDIGYGIRNREDLQDVINFFYARRGRAFGFLFKDWLDFSVTAESVGTTGTATTRQLQKAYPDTANGYVRAILHPIETTLKVYINNFLVSSPAVYSLDPNGILTFVSDPGVNVKATFEFDVPVRFDIDALSVTLNTYREGVINSIPIIELKE